MTIHWVIPAKKIKILSVNEADWNIVNNSVQDENEKGNWAILLGTIQQKEEMKITLWKGRYCKHQGYSLSVKG